MKYYIFSITTCQLVGTVKAQSMRQAKEIANNKGYFMDDYFLSAERSPKIAGRGTAYNSDYLNYCA